MFLVKFVQENKHILEDTCKCGTMRLQKKKKWIELSNALLCMGKSHGWKDLRLFYKALKYRAKHKVRSYIEGSNAKKSQAMPDKEDYILSDICSMDSKMANRFLHECVRITTENIDDQLQGQINNSKSIPKKKRKYTKRIINQKRQKQQQAEIVRDLLDTNQAAFALSESQATETAEKQSCPESLLELHKKQWTFKLELQMQEHEARMALLREEERYKKMLNDYALEEKRMRIAILQKQLENLTPTFG